MADQNDQLSDIQASAGTNLSLLVGQLQGGFREVKQLLLDQNQQHIRDKEEAIAERDRRHEESKTEIRAVRVAMDGTAAATAKNSLWIEQKGEPLIGRVSNLEQINNAEAAAKAQVEEGQKLVAAEKRGWWRAWGKIGAAFAAIGGVIVLLLENFSTIYEIVKQFFAHEGGEMTAGKAKAAAGGALLLAVGLVGVYEGTIKHTYLDAGGVPTICTGHTGADVKMGQTATGEICSDFLEHDMAWAFAVEDKALTHPEHIPAPARAAMASFIFNLGATVWLSSPMPQLLNLGKIAEACNALLPYNMAPVLDTVTGKQVIDPKTGKPLKKVYYGLVRRREAERHLCLGEAW